LTPSDSGQGITRYRLKFVPDALEEWHDLDGSIKEPLRKALRKRLEMPNVPGAELHGDLLGCYKIKLRKLIIFSPSSFIRRQCPASVGNGLSGRLS